MKPKILFAILFVATVISLTGCYTTTAILGNSYAYKYNLVEPGTDSTIVDNASGMKFSDDKMDIQFTIDATSINFKLQNKTNSALKIQWDEASIVQFGQSHRVMHSGVKYTDRNSSQPPTVIPPMASIDDLAFPADNAYYKEGYYSAYSSIPGGWKERDLFPMHDLNKEDIKGTILSMKGQKFSLYLPIVWQEKTIEYNFNFLVNDVQPNVNSVVK